MQGAAAIASQLQKLIFPLAERDQEVAIGPRDVPQSDGNTSRRRQG